MKAIIDTCIIVDVLQKREKFFEDSYSVFIAVANQLFEGVICASAVTDIYYIMHRHFHDDSQTRKTLETLFKLFSVADTTGYDCKKALISQISDYEDAVMIETAARIKADCIVTRNEKDYRNSDITVYTPKEFLEAFEKQD